MSSHRPAMNGMVCYFSWIWIFSWKQSPRTNTSQTFRDSMHILRNFIHDIFLFNTKVHNKTFSYLRKQILSTQTNTFVHKSQDLYRTIGFKNFQPTVAKSWQNMRNNYNFSKVFLKIMIRHWKKWKDPVLVQEYHLQRLVNLCLYVSTEEARNLPWTPSPVSSDQAGRDQSL